MKEEIGFLKEELKNVQQKYDTMLTVRSGIQMSISRSKKYFLSDVWREGGGGRGVETRLTRREGDV